MINALRDILGNDFKYRNYIETTFCKHSEMTVRQYYQFDSSLLCVVFYDNKHVYSKQINNTRGIQFEKIK